MGFFSKLWKGVKNVVKKVARTVKKVSKTLVTALPGGKKLWEFGGKVGDAVKKGIGWIGEKLGPVGMIALSFVLPGIGAFLAPLWASFGAGAAAMAATGSGIVSALGTAGTAIFNGANFVAGTAGALSNALTEGVKTVFSGGLDAGSKVFMENMKSAFSGEAGKAAVLAGQKAAALSGGGTSNVFQANPETGVMEVKGTTNLDTITESRNLVSDSLSPPGADSIRDFSSAAEGLPDFSRSIPSAPSTPDTFSLPENLDDMFTKKPFVKPQMKQATTGFEPMTYEEIQAAVKPTFMEKVKDVAQDVMSNAGGASGGGGSSDPAPLGIPGTLNRTDISDASRAQAIRAVGSGNNVLDRLLQQSMVRV